MKKFIVLVTLLASPAFAHDDKRPDLNGWFESLRSAKGPCCSDADGSAVIDSDWESVQGKPNIHYRVRLARKNIPGEPMEWVDVPDAAVLTQPNLYGRTMVWAVYGYEGMTIRCFIPGPGG